MIYGWNVAAVYSGQGRLTATANFALLALWLASVTLTAIGRHRLVLDAVTAALFAVAALSSTLLFASGPARLGGLALAILWLTALHLRIARGDER